MPRKSALPPARHAQPAPAARGVERFGAHRALSPVDAVGGIRRRYMTEMGFEPRTTILHSKHSAEPERASIVEMFAGLNTANSRVPRDSFSQTLLNARGLSCSDRRTPDEPCQFQLSRRPRVCAPAVRSAQLTITGCRSREATSTVWPTNLASRCLRPGAPTDRRLLRRQYEQLCSIRRGQPEAFGRLSHCSIAFLYSWKNYVNTALPDPLGLHLRGH